jgi:pyrroline-5-carboxylate reductase
MKLRRLAVLGGGNMGGALAAGLVSTKTLTPSAVVIADKDLARLAALKKTLGVRTTGDNHDAVADADVVLLCVKPQQMADVLAELRGRLTVRQTVISVAAGIRSRTIETSLGGRGVTIPVVRVMPNTPALERAGAMVYALGRAAGPTQDRLARTLLTPLGRIWRVDERLMDAVTALSGSGPAYVFFLAECLAAAGRTVGLPRELAEALARQTVYGAGVLLDRRPLPAGELRRQVTSPGGTTEAALRVLNEAALPKIFERALDAARRRSQELSTAPPGPSIHRATSASAGAPRP